jgi:hypothetical protein
MPAAATSRLRLIKQETYSNPDAWGVYLNSGALDMADQAFGVAEIAVGANVSLDTQNFVNDEARRLVLILSGAGGFSITAPAVDKPYLVINDCAADVTIGPFGGSFATVRAGTAVWYTTNAAGTAGRVIDPTLDKMRPAAGSVDFGGQRAVNGADAVNPTDFTTLQQIGPFADAAAQSAADALASELATEGLYTDFQQKYLGEKASPPSVDNEGDPLIPGQLYFDTTLDQLQVWNGSSWQGGVTDTSNLVARLVPQMATSATNAIEGYAYYCDSTSGAFNVTFPSSPASGSRIGITTDSTAETNAVTIKLNGNTLDGSTSDVVIKVPSSLEFIFFNSQWRLAP